MGDVTIPVHRSFHIQKLPKKFNKLSNNFRKEIQSQPTIWHHCYFLQCSVRKKKRFASHNRLGEILIKIVIDSFAGIPQPSRADVLGGWFSRTNHPFAAGLIQSGSTPARSETARPDVDGEKKATLSGFPQCCSRLLCAGWLVFLLIDVVCRTFCLAVYFS